MADNSILIDEQTPVDPEYARKIEILRNSYRKLDSLPLGFGIPAYDDSITDGMVDKLFGLDLSDALREMRMNVTDVESNSYTEMMVENRVVYYAIRRFRLSASVFFKFSTATDGKTVDKTGIPKMLNTILAEYNAEFKSWRGNNAGSLWNMTGR